MSCSNHDLRRKLPLYETGMLGAEDVREMERHLQECPECAEDFYTMLPVSEQIRAMDTPFPEPAATGLAGRLYHLRWVALAAAAMVLLSVSVIVVFYGPRLGHIPPSAPAADLHHVFEEMENRQPDIYRPDLMSSPLFLRALQLYSDGRYAECLRAGNRIIQQEGPLTGVILLNTRCLLRLERYTAALKLLKNHPLDTTRSEYPDYLWLKARALIGMDRRDAARPLLDELVRRGGRLSQEARQILQLLDRPDPLPPLP